jgi:oligopeptidase B
LVRGGQASIAFRCVLAAQPPLTARPRSFRLLKKKATFSDYEACAESLIAGGWTVPGAIAVHGASAGGLLCGVALNSRPDLWACVVSDVGFVDVVQSVADPTIPLAVTEWEEWASA